MISLRMRAWSACCAGSGVMPVGNSSASAIATA
jgi:hypothetical protein